MFHLPVFWWMVVQEEHYIHIDSRRLSLFDLNKRPTTLANQIPGPYILILCTSTFNPPSLRTRENPACDETKDTGK